MNAPSPERSKQIRAAVRSKYRQATENPAGLFSYPVGEEGALGLGYHASWFRLVSRDVLHRFVGVGNPFSIRTPGPGGRVLDAGCGCGLDTFIAASMSGPAGKAIGIDLTLEMLVFPKAAAGSFKGGNAEFVQASVENLPFDNDSFDIAISNGVLNLVPDKPSAFKELARVLRSGGALVCADLLVKETIPQSVLEDIDAWSS